LQSSDSHDYFNILDVAHKCFFRSHHQKVRGDLAILDSSKENCVYKLQHKEFQKCTIEPFSSSIKEQHYVEINHPRYAKDIEHEQFNMIEDFRSFSPFVAPHKQKITVTYRAEKLKGLHEQFKQ